MIKYAEVSRRFDANIHHSNDIWTYTTETNILHCFHWLQHVNNLQLSSFFVKENIHVLDINMISNESQKSSENNMSYQVRGKENQK